MWIFASIFESGPGTGAPHDPVPGVGVGPGVGSGVGVGPGAGVGVGFGTGVATGLGDGIPKTGSEMVREGLAGTWSPLVGSSSEIHWRPRSTIPETPDPALRF